MAKLALDQNFDSWAALVNRLFNTQELEIQFKGNTIAKSIFVTPPMQNAHYCMRITIEFVIKFIFSCHCNTKSRKPMPKDDFGYHF